MEHVVEISNGAVRIETPAISLRTILAAPQQHAH
jgi:hypothetical protein